MTALFVIRLICTLMFGITAGVLCYNGLDGWGWFLFAAVLAVPVTE